jgi:hypothetical protein
VGLTLVLRTSTCHFRARSIASSKLGEWRTGWNCQFLGVNLKTHPPRKLHFSTQDKVIELVGQFLITRNIMTTAPEMKSLDGRPIVAVDEDGTRYFKRLQCSGQIAILESLNPDGTTASELLAFDDSLSLPKITHAIEVIGVLFELP